MIEMEKTIEKKETFIYPQAGQFTRKKKFIRITIELYFKINSGLK